MPILLRTGVRGHRHNNRHPVPACRSQCRKPDSEGGDTTSATGVRRQPVCGGIGSGDTGQSRCERRARQTLGRAHACQCVRVTRGFASSPQPPPHPPAPWRAGAAPPEIYLSVRQGHGRLEIRRCVLLIEVQQPPPEERLARSCVHAQGHTVTKN
jgi:hypothetical protein